MVVVLHARNSSVLKQQNQAFCTHSKEGNGKNSFRQKKLSNTNPLTFISSCCRSVDYWCRITKCSHHFVCPKEHSTWCIGSWFYLTSRITSRCRSNFLLFSFRAVQFNIFQLKLRSNSAYWKEVLEVVSSDSQTRVTSDRHVFHCTSKFCWWKWRTVITTTTTTTYRWHTLHGGHNRSFVF
jgi:hypothetical protein